MLSRTWNMKLTATDQYPETTLTGVMHDVALDIVRGLMYGPASHEHKHVEAAVRSSRARSQERAAA